MVYKLFPLFLLLCLNTKYCSESKARYAADINSVQRHVAALENQIAEAAAQHSCELATVLCWLVLQNKNKNGNSSH